MQLAAVRGRQRPHQPVSVNGDAQLLLQTPQRRLGPSTARKSGSCVGSASGSNVLGTQRWPAEHKLPWSPH